MEEDLDISMSAAITTPLYSHNCVSGLTPHTTHCGDKNPPMFLWGNLSTWILGVPLGAPLSSVLTPIPPIIATVSATLSQLSFQPMSSSVLLYTSLLSCHCSLYLLSSDYPDTFSYPGLELNSFKKLKKIEEKK